MSTTKSRQKFHTRGFTSFLAALCFLVVVVSGVILYFTPQGRVAHWTDWRIFGLDKEQWSAVHINCCLLFVIATIVHIYFNWSALWRYIKKKTAVRLNLKWELLIAVILCVIVVVGTLYSIPPFGTIMKWSDDIELYWERTSPRHPYPHAEESTLDDFAWRIGVASDDLAQALRFEEFDVSDMTITIGELARQKGVPPSGVFEAIKKHHPEAGIFKGRGGGTGGRGRGMGLGQGAGRGQRR